MNNPNNFNSTILTSWQHAALILSKKITAGSKKGNEEFKKLLAEFGTMNSIFEHYFGMISIDENINSTLNKSYDKLKVDFNVLTINDDMYPNELKSIYGLPPVYYYRGDLNILKMKKSISFVGTRELDNSVHISQGIHAIERLINAGYEVIVSGLAKGSDTLGHRTAISLGAKTIAVLGTPINVSYPAENKLLQEEIAIEHLVVSEYPVGINTVGSYFANRNLTTVSLSYEGVVVARAGDKSGTQYAIKTCLEQNKPLYVLENNIYEPDYTWVNKYKKNLKVIR